jgi:hypothetical protein
MRPNIRNKMILKQKRPADFEQMDRADLSKGSGIVFVGVYTGYR